MTHVLFNRPLRFQALYDLLMGAVLTERPAGSETREHLSVAVGLPEAQHARCSHPPLAKPAADPRR